MRRVTEFCCQGAALGFIAVSQYGLAALTHDHASRRRTDARRAAAQQDDLVLKTGQGATSS